MAGIVAVFDFDKTIIDLDSDNWVVDELGFTDLFNQLLPTMPWNTLMDTMMKELHSNGKTIDDIVKVLERVPIHPRIVPAIKAAHALGCELRIVSDANLFFIETIVKHLGLTDYFSEINTNPSYVDEEGRLRIFPCHDFHSSPHGCNLCPPNMCKGMVMERIQASVEGKKKFVYLGDGSGDFCPSLKLREGDHVMPRKDYPVWDLICKNRSHIKAEIHEWSDGEDLEPCCSNSSTKFPWKRLTGCLQKNASLRRFQWLPTSPSQRLFRFLISGYHLNLSGMPKLVDFDFPTLLW